jgi:hypothetical protein
MVFRVALDEPAAGEEAALLGELPDPAVLAVDELPHAAAIRATPARPAGAHHRLRITYPTRRRMICLLPARNAQPVRSPRKSRYRARPGKTEESEDARALARHRTGTLTRVWPPAVVTTKPRTLEA